MSKVLSLRDNLDIVHQAHLQASLARRLEVAKAKDDRPLIALLEQEQQQLQPTSHPEHPETSHDQQAWMNWFRTAWQSITQDVIHPSELRVWQKVDQAGVSWWCAYDPFTGKSVCTDSESEMRFWIEENYNGR